MVIITKKVKCNGRKFQGYKFYVEVTDGNAILMFKSDGGDKLRMEDFLRAETKHHAYHYGMDMGLKILPSYDDGKDDLDEQYNIMRLALAASYVPIVFVGENCEHTYIA